MSDEEIVVTGMGVWSAAGCTPGDLWQSARIGRATGVLHECGGLQAVACPAPDPGPCARFPQSHRMDRSTRLALAAANRAYSAARLAELHPARVAVLVGNSRGPAEKWFHTTARTTQVRPTEAAHSAVASLSGALSLAFGIQGPCLTVSATCASGGHAIALGAGLLQSGMVDAVVAGGAEAPLVPELLKQFDAAGLLGRDPDPALACRPFDIARNGLVPGEGAGFLVLERSGSAMARAVRIEGVLAGWAMGAESHSRVAARADGTGVAHVIEQALRVARINPEAIGYINAHGTGTKVNDAAEAAGFRLVFGEHVSSIAISSTKAVTGHGLGAAAAWEAVLTVEALRNQVAPPTTGLVRPDPALAISPVLGAARDIEAHYALSTSLGFWGNTAALVFRSASVPA